MKTLTAAAFVGLLCAGLLFGQKPSEYTATEAGKHIGETAKVTGTVDGTHQAEGGSIFLNLDGKYPNHAFTVFIPGKSADKFGNYKDYEGDTITVSGKIDEHKNKPQIIVTDPSDITKK